MVTEIKDKQLKNIGGDFFKPQTTRLARIQFLRETEFSHEYAPERIKRNTIDIKVG